METNYAEKLYSAAGDGFSEVSKKFLDKHQISYELIGRDKCGVRIYLIDDKIISYINNDV